MLLAIDIGNTKIKLGCFNTSKKDFIFTDYNTFDEFKKNIVNPSTYLPENCYVHLQGEEFALQHYQPS